MRRVVLLLIASTVILFATPLFAAEFIAPNKVVGIATVTDGDTVRVNGITVRLYGIDAPVGAQSCNAKNGGKWSCGADATKALKKLVNGKELECDRTGAGQDLYSRMIAICKLASGQDVNAEMINQGMAWSFKQYSHVYDALEEKAKASGLGIWQATCTQTPWDYRHNAWEDALRQAPEGKPIKGNFARKGQCIYHTPWSPAWRKVNMEKAGNKWFATEADAINAGCRAPYRMARMRHDISPDAIKAALPCSGALAAASVR